MEGVSSAAIEVLVQNLINFIKDEYILRRDLHKEAQQLQKTLGMIQAYLNDAEKKSISEETVKIWLRELEALAFDADNVVDELGYHLLRKKVKKMEAPPKKKVLLCFSSFKHNACPRNMALKIKSFAHRRDTALKIREINTKFESINKRAAELSLQSMVVNAPLAVHASYETDSISVDPIFIGRDDVVLEIVENLVTESTRVKERKLFMVAIVGMGGMGKTTLTRKVFNHQKMKTRFGTLVWVHVSQTFDSITLFKKILSTLTLQSSSSSNGVKTREVILRKLQEELKGKTYLLVLDDIWNEDLSKWKDFIDAIAGVTSSMGNGIIVTTRNTEVASIVSPHHTHYLRGLSNEECWSIIKAKAFGENGQVPSSEFEVIGKEIARRCHGLPLAANVVGGVLFRCKSAEEWRSINENPLLEGGGENILKILKLSFDHLASPSLKKCFAYCSVLPKGRRFTKQEMIEMWMAEGFLEVHGRNEDLESVGNKYFNVLLHNSLLPVTVRDDDGNVEWCVMHDLVHDLARSVLGMGVNDSSCCNQPRSIHYGDYEDNLALIPKEWAKHLRTLFFRGKTSDTIFSNFESLRNLSLMHSESDRVIELPSSIKKLIHLRKLDIRRTEINELPEWIGKLHHLQTLRVGTPYLKKLPSTLKYLINLRHLYIYEYTELPAEIGRLSRLQTLEYFRVGDKKGCQIEELGSLNNLKGRLTIDNLEKVGGKEEAEKANISQKLNLLNLTLEWGGRGDGVYRNDESVLEGLQPHPNLNKLGITRFMGKTFPAWTMKMAVRDGPQSSWKPLDNLVEINLLYCNKCEEIPMMGHLPNLKSLLLVGLKNVRFMNNSPSSNNLVKLTLEDLEGLECMPDWLFYNNPNLSYLKIEECPKLRELPDGLHTLISLEELNIRRCPNLKSMGNPSGRGQSPGILRRLSIKLCEGLMELPHGMIESWAPSLERLVLEDLSSLENLPMIIDCLARSATRLRELRIDGVPKFMATRTTSGVEISCWDLGSLRELQIDVSMEWSRESSIAIKETVEGMLQGCSSSSLHDLILKGVEEWESIPESIQHLAALSELTLENFGVEELPEWLGNLSSLRSLTLTGCNKLRRLPSGDAYKGLTKLRYLSIRHCPKLLSIDSEWHNKPNLDITVDGYSIKPRSQ